VFVFACALLLLAQSLYATPVFVVVWVCGFVWVHVCVCERENERERARERERERKR